MTLAFETTPVKQFFFSPSFNSYSVPIQSFTTAARDVTVNDLSFITLTSPLALPGD